MRSKLMLLSFKLILLCFLIPKMVLGDSNHDSDSLFLLLETTSGTERLEVYNQLIQSLNNINPARGIDIARESEAEAALS